MLLVFLSGLATMGTGFVILIATGIMEFSEWVARKRSENYMREQKLKRERELQEREEREKALELQREREREYMRAYGYWNWEPLIHD